MDIQKFLDEFVEVCKNKLNLYSIVQFGSSTYSKDFNDIDLLFVFNEGVISTKNLLKLRKIISDFEKDYSEVLFDFGGTSTRKRNASFEVTIVLLGLKDLKVEHNPHDLFFFKILSLEKNKKILFGQDLFENLYIQLTNKHLYEMLSVDVKHLMRTSLDDFDYLSSRLYSDFKSFLRAMLINKGDFRKGELLEKFKDYFGKNIDLPKNSREILDKKIVEKDFKDILNFFESCLRYLSK